MNEVKFLVNVGDDQVIHPPSGVTLPQGEVEVTVRPTSVPTSLEADPLAPTRAWLLGLADEAEADANPDLPSDLAEHHDYYAHGKPRT